jgi:hypothetical protein
MARSLQTKIIRAQSLTFSDWCAEVRDLAGERWPEVADQCATLYAVWGGGATPAQALHMVSLILPPKAAVDLVTGDQKRLPNEWHRPI